VARGAGARGESAGASKKRGPAPQTPVLVFGGEPIGALIALVCRHRGARVILSEINPYRVALLEGLGLEVVGPGVDVSFEVTGMPPRSGS